MIALQVSILCRKDERDEEDIQLANRLQEMGVPLRDESVNEWRDGFVMAEKIETFYPMGKRPEHTVIEMLSGRVVTVKENTLEIIAMLTENTSLKQEDNGKRIYNYQTVIR